MQAESLSLFQAEKTNIDQNYPDQGSGLYVKHSKQYRIIGIVSHRGKDEENKKIFKFVNIENLRKWMDDALMD